MNRKEVTTYTVAIYIGGDLSDARRICRKVCMRGLCVTVEPLDFVYTGGAEAGVRVGLINYPRFPVEPDELFVKAEALAITLMEGLYQHSASIVAPDKTIWLSRRPEHQAEA